MKQLLMFANKSRLIEKASFLDFLFIHYMYLLNLENIVHANNNWLIW